MATRKITIKTTARRSSSGNINVRTAVSNGRTTKTSSKTIRIK